MNLDLFLKSMREFVASMTDSYDPASMCYTLSNRVVEALEADGAGVTVANRQGELRYVTATEGRAAALEKAQEEVQTGPCTLAFMEGRPVAVTDISTTRRWPAYTDLADEVGYKAILGVPLKSGDVKFGALDVYDVEPREWTHDEIGVAEAFADMATAYLVRTSELEEASRLAGQLQGALDSRVLIEQAKGMIATRNDIDVDAAFNLLRTEARSNRVKLTELARRVVEREIDITKS